VDGGGDEEKSISTRKPIEPALEFYRPGEKRTEVKINTTPRFRADTRGPAILQVITGYTESGDRIYSGAGLYIYTVYLYILYVQYTDELGTAVRVTKVSLVNCPEMTIKRSGPVGLWALGDPFGGNVYGSPQAASPVRLLFRRRRNKAAANKNCEKNIMQDRQEIPTHFSPSHESRRTHGTYTCSPPIAPNHVFRPRREYRQTAVIRHLKHTHTHTHLYTYRLYLRCRQGRAAVQTYARGDKSRERTRGSAVKTISIVS